MSPERSSLIRSHAEVSLLMMVFSDNEIDKNDKSTNYNNKNKVRLRGYKYIHEVRLKGTRYILFVELVPTHGKNFPSRLFKEPYI